MKLFGPTGFKRRQSNRRKTFDLDNISNMSVALAANVLHENVATKIINVRFRESAATGSDAHAEKKLAAAREFVTEGHSFFSTSQDTTPIYNGDHPNLAKLEAVRAVLLSKLGRREWC